MVEELDELIELLSQLDNRLESNEKFYLRCCLVPEEQEYGENNVKSFELTLSNK
jgi:hypothetical protein